MSQGTKLAWRDAYGILRGIALELRPHVRRMKAGGSIRRGRAFVGDLELIIEPNMVDVSLLGDQEPDLGEVRRILRRAGTWVKGGDRFIQVTDVNERKGLQLDVWICWPPAQWGSILAIRTGPAELGHIAMMRLTDRQRSHTAGHVVDLKTRAVLPTPDEASFFQLAGLPHWPPAKREELVAAIRNGVSVERMLPL